MKKIKCIFLIVVLVLFDQIIKNYVVYYKDNLPKPIINNVLCINYCENRGMAFGLAQGKYNILAGITLIILLTVFIIAMVKCTKINKKMLVCICVVVSGGIGNLIDRLFRGYVVDYIDFSQLCGFPIFNFADILVVLGTISVGLLYLTKKEGDEE